MKIGIDISQLAYQGTGVASYLRNLILNLSKLDKKNEYILFFSSLRGKLPKLNLDDNFKIKKFNIPPTVLDILWNKLHVMPIESFIGDVDVFITSDWTEPPVRKTKKATILYDLIIYKHKDETHGKTSLNFLGLNILPNIVSTQNRKLEWVKKESNIVFCISEATKNDAMSILGIHEDKLRVIYPGVDES